MKKAIVFLILAATLLGLLVGCGSKETAAARERTPIEKARDRAVEIGQQYLDFEITASEAKQLLGDITVPEVESGDGSLFLRSAINHLVFILGRQGTTYEDVESEVEHLVSMDFELYEQAGELSKR